MKKGFTLSEILITLVVIGIVSAITVPAIMQSIHNQEFKVGYKKAYSDLSRAALRGVAFGEFPIREKKTDAVVTAEEWNILKSQFGILKECNIKNCFDCWVDAEKIYTTQPTVNSKSFIDLAGRSWALFFDYENIFLVDTNGNKKPNHFGKDRWIFTFVDKDGYRVCDRFASSEDGNLGKCSNPSLPYKVSPYISKDVIKYNQSYCQHPPCRYYSWLFE